MWVWGLLFLALAVMVYVRAAPVDTNRWHLPIQGAADHRSEGSALRVLPDRSADLARLDEIAQTTLRTHVVAGSVEEGRVTYVTRSAFWGFPDFTTIEARNDGSMAIYARLRFGRSDFGVNAARIEVWLAELG